MLSPPALAVRPAGPLATLRGAGLHLPRSRWYWLPIPAFLVEHPGAGPVLVDAGLHASVAGDPAVSLGARMKAISKFRVTDDQNVPARLRARDVDPGDVRTIVMTHLHYDHTSGLADFPGRTIVVDRREWDAASGPRPFVEGYNHRHLALDADWRTIEDDAPFEPFATFARTLDLFGDGSVRLLSTPGHALGHQSVLLRTATHEVLLAGDAVYTHANLRAEADPLLAADRHLLHRSRDELARFAELTPSALIVPGHDPEAWAALQPVYA
jgi:glyoxylase-like metal-dependent hydrolase (beta-lactamase superfamily II)